MVPMHKNHDHMLAKLQLNLDHNGTRNQRQHLNKACCHCQCSSTTTLFRVLTTALEKGNLKCLCFEGNIWILTICI